MFVGKEIQTRLLFLDNRRPVIGDAQTIIGCGVCLLFLRVLPPSRDPSKAEKWKARAARVDAWQ